MQLGINCYPLIDSSGISYQGISEVKIMELPIGPEKALRPVIVVKASAYLSDAGDGTALGTFVFGLTDMGFSQMLADGVDQSGWQAFISNGPLTGFFVSAHQINLGEREIYTDPLHYQINVYSPIDAQYIRVLSVITTKSYPNKKIEYFNPDNIKKLLLPQVISDLDAIYSDSERKNLIKPRYGFIMSK